MGRGKKKLRDLSGTETKMGSRTVSPGGKLDRKPHRFQENHQAYHPIINLVRKPYQKTFPHHSLLPKKKSGNP